MPQPTAAIAETAHDILRGRAHPLDVFFAPQSVAVIGASDKRASVGRTVIWNLLSSPFGGTVFPINPARDAVLGIKAYPNIAAAPARVDLAVIATPAATVPAVIAECVEAGVKGAIIISAGFRETGSKGAELEAEILVRARRGRMRVIGPNCVGLMSPLTGINATFLGAMARPGDVAFVSQSGALCAAILDWSLREFVGFSSFISIGSMVDVGWGDLIDYLGDDPRTRSIILYIESIGDPRSVLSAARQVALTKPIIVIKAGRSPAAARAAASHTGALTGSDEVLDAAFRRVGVLRVDSIADLFFMAEVLAKQPRPRGPRLAIVTNAGGPGVLATDALAALGGEPAPLTPETLKALDAILPPHWSHGNPVDTLGDASPALYAKAVEIVAKDENADGLVVLAAGQGLADPAETAEALKPHAHLPGKPILASFMGGAQVAPAESILNRSGIPTFPYPDAAVRMFHYMWRYTYNLRGIYETPQLVADAGGAEGGVRATIGAARAAGRTILTEFESKQILTAYGIPVVETRLALSEEDAARQAKSLGYPVALKLHSETITHKTDVGGVQLYLGNEAAVRKAYAAIAASVREKAGCSVPVPGALKETDGSGGVLTADPFQGVTVQPMVRLAGYEVILGSTLDPQFGPVLLFGAGGQLVEIFHDRALALPPLNTTLARRMMEQTRVFKALQGTRGRRAVDLGALEQLLVRFSRLVMEQRAIREIDVNPLLVSADGMLALDARIILNDASIPEDQLPPPAIRPYPSRYVAPATLKDGRSVTIRPIRPEDEILMVKFHQALSERSVYLRYFHTLSLDRRVAHERLTRICFVDYDREMVLVAERQGAGGESEIVGVGRASRLPGTAEAETAILVRDSCQKQGLGTELLRRVIAFARDEKIHALGADTLAENIEMQQICRKLGFEIHRHADDPSLVRAVLRLDDAV